MHLLTLTDLSYSELLSVVKRGCELAEDFESGTLEASLSGKRVGLIVDDGGWRNTTAMDLGVQLLGASCVNVPVSLGEYDDISDLARYLSNWFHLIAVRSPSLKKMRQLAQSSDIPVVNLRTRVNHPCETLGDLSFIQSRRGSVEGLSVIVVSPAANIIHSWAEAASVLPITLTQISPAEYWIDQARYPDAQLTCVDELSALTTADVIITDCWPDDVALEVVHQFQITANLLDETKEACLFIPCPPVTRGAEVTKEAMTHEKCVVYKAKSYLMHAQNALVEHYLCG